MNIAAITRSNGAKKGDRWTTLRQALDGGVLPWHGSPGEEKMVAGGDREFAREVHREIRMPGSDGSESGSFWIRVRRCRGARLLMVVLGTSTLP